MRYVQGRDMDYGIHSSSSPTPKRHVEAIAHDGDLWASIHVETHDVMFPGQPRRDCTANQSGCTRHQNPHDLPRSIASPGIAY